MAADGVAEMKADAVAFHLPAGEIEVGSRGIAPCIQDWVILGQADLQRRIAEARVVGQQFLQDLDHGFVVKIRWLPATGQPEPRPQGQIIAVPVLADAGPTRGCDDAVKGAHAVMGLDLDAGMGADEGVEIQIVAGRQRLDAVFEEIVQVIRAVETQKRQGCQVRDRSSGGPDARSG